MKFTSEIIVEVPRDAMIGMMDNPDNMKYWQKGLVSYQLLSEQPSAAGSQMRLEYKMGRRKVVLTETILINQFPEKFSAAYETKGVWNKVDNYFHIESTNRTRWVSENEFKFSGLMKFMSLLMPSSMFKKQACGYMEDFKKFAEKEYNSDT